MDDELTMSRFRRYLKAKRTVDDRALNHRIWARLRDELEKLETRTLEVADVGAGIGVGAERMLDWRLFEGFRPRYCAVDVNQELLDEAGKRLRGKELVLETVAADLQAFASREENYDRFDLVVAHALLDILELVPSLRSLLHVTRPGGLLHIPIAFDGESFFEPPDPADQVILGHYCDTMEEKGDSRTGRRIFHALSEIGAEILEVGSSDWVVVPKDGTYPNDEAFFLCFIVHTVEGAVQERHEDVHRWASLRRRQVEQGQLVYIAHQLDYLVKKRD